MPGASVKVGPVSVGSGCCVALVVPVLIVGLLVCLFVGLSSAATPSAKNARKATYNEINNTQPLFEGIEKNEENNIHCNRLTHSRYHCSFQYYSQADVQHGCIEGDRGYS